MVVSRRVVGKGCGHFCTAILVVEGLHAALVHRTHRNGVDAGDIAIGSAGVAIVPTIPACPDVYGTETITPLSRWRIGMNYLVYNDTAHLVSSMQCGLLSYDRVIEFYNSVIHNTTYIHVYTRGK